MPFSSIPFRALLLLCLPALSHAQAPLTTTLVSGGFTKPLCITHAPGDPARLFVVEKTGKIRIVQGGVVRPTPFIDLASLVNATTLEWGLLSMCFDPNYTANGFFYVNYSSGPGGDTNIARFQVTADPNVADLASHFTILYLPQPNPNHRGGWLGFGPDGYLYDSQGDGGPQEDPNNNAQNTALLQGKILRLDVSGDDFPADPDRNYRIPPTNPFVGQAGFAPEIWALGLRNPWRCSFDRLTGDLWVTDVGEYAREEIDFQPAGAGGQNYGWRCTEGTQCTVWGGCTCNGPTLTPPIHDYGHLVGRSITGGYVYRGSAIAGLQGTYVFGDFQLGKLWSLYFDGSSVSALTERTAELDPPGSLAIEHPASFGEDANGELYVCDYMDGEVYAIVAAPDLVAPTIAISSPTNRSAWATTSSLLDLAGIASDNVGVSGVTWANDRGGAGVANGTTSWSASTIALAFGSNVITVSATDAALNSASAILTVTCLPTPAGYCFGDGSGTPCPCGNAGAPGNGCQNSLGADGAHLDFSGEAHLVAADTLVLVGTGLSNSTVTFFQGTTQHNGGLGTAFGDGLRCAGGSIVRLGAVPAVGGSAQFPDAGAQPVSVRGMVTSVGSLRTYQVWYRNAANYCTSATFNLTNGLVLAWGP